MKKILIIEPDSEVRSIIKSFISKNEIKWKVKVAEDAQQAIHECDTDLPDVIVLETQMASNNGLAFIHEFRSHGDWLSVPIIIHTMIPQLETGLTNNDWKSMGVTEYLYKPTTSLKKLVITIKKASKE